MREALALMQSPAGAESAAGSLLVEREAPDLSVEQFCGVAAEDIRRFSASLDALPQDIFMGRFGLGRPASSLTSLGKKYGLTRERIRQIEAETVQFLKPEL